MEETYNLELTFGLNLYDCYKPKQISMIRSLIEQSRLGNELTFSGYGEIEIGEDYYKPVITLSDKSSRKTGCIVYDIDTASARVHGLYDKLFIFYMDPVKSRKSYYCYCLYNSTTRKSSSVPYFETESYGEIAKHINMSFQTYSKLDIYEFYSNKYDYIKGRSSHFPLISELKEANERIINRFFDGIKYIFIK